MQLKVLETVKARMVQEAPQYLLAFYNDFLQPTTVPDRKAKKSKRRYFSRPNDDNRLRTNYGNIQRALQKGETGNITEIVVKDGKVLLLSGIDTNKEVKAGPDRVKLEYARYHEEGTKNFRARPFLNPGFEMFVNQGLPEIIELIEDDLVKVYNGR